MKTVEEGSTTAKNGFANEIFVINNFNSWKSSSLGQQWLKEMDYELSNIEDIIAHKISGQYKSDVQIHIKIKLKDLLDYQNISVKLVSNYSGFNQVDKRRVQKYEELWSIPEDVVNLLKLYTGENQPTKEHSRDTRRMFLDEFSVSEADLLIEFFNKNKLLILSDIIRGRGMLSAEWMLVICKIKTSTDIKSKIVSINKVLNLYSSGDVVMTKNGNLRIGKITMQRKGGDGGRDSAKMLQFKFNPALLLDTN